LHYIYSESLSQKKKKRKRKKVASSEQEHLKKLLVGCSDSCLLMPATWEAEIGRNVVCGAQAKT
jgi:hypothetical protein